MATGQNTSTTLRRQKVKQIRNMQQKLHFFKWKLWKYEDASDTYFMERNYDMVDLCDKNVAAYRKAHESAGRLLMSLKEQLAAM